MGNIRPLHLQRAGFLMRPQPATTPELATAIPKARGQLHAVNLLTEGLAECMTASLRPAFSWQLAQPDGSDPARALQTGYEVTVEDAQGLKFWSSGPVPSPAQRGVTYDGPALDGDTDYAWRTRASRRMVRAGGQGTGRWGEPATRRALLRISSGARPPGARRIQSACQESSGRPVLNIFGVDHSPGIPAASRTRTRHA